MSAGVELVGTKRRWLASAAGAVVIVAAGLLLMRVPAPPPAPLATGSTPSRATRPAVELAKAGAVGQALTEEAVLHDQRPLFLPTERNVALRPPRRPEAGRTVLDQDASHLVFGAAELKLGLPQPEIVAEKPAEVMLKDAAPTPLHGFGRANPDVQPDAPRGGFLEVRSTATNRRMLAFTLGIDAKPPTERPWKPVEFLVRVDAAGLVGPLTITVRSDVEEVDRFFRNYLGGTFRIGERLPPGFYRVVVGP
jgi:hypothetical protein